MPVPQEINFVVEQASCLFITGLLTIVLFGELKLEKNISSYTWVVERKRFDTYNEVSNDG
jgi:hypothetical protein